MKQPKKLVRITAITAGVALVGLAATFSAHAATFRPAQKDIASVDSAVTSFMSKYSVPGVSIAVTKNDNLVYAKSYGTVGSTTTTPGAAVTNRNLFRIASVSKPITSVAIMKLMESGKLTLDSKVFGPGSILGATYPTAPSATYDITVRNLLQHTVGAWGATNDPMFQQPTMTQQQLINWTLANYPAPASGRGTFVYSNFGYCLLGRIVEKLSGKTYQQYVQTAVLTPSGISDMSIGGNTLAQRKTNEVIYTGQGGENPYAYNITRMDSHGGWIATATDLARILVRVDGFTGKADILKSATISTMTTPNPASSYADGWYANSANNWWHTGSLPGTGTEIVRSSGGFNWVILTNTRSTDPAYFSAIDGLLWPAVNDPATPWQAIDQF